MHPESIAVFIPIIALMIPIVALLVRHQQRMTELLHQNNHGQAQSELEGLRREVRELKELVHEQTIALDSVRRATAPAPQMELKV